MRQGTRHRVGPVIASCLLALTLMFGAAPIVAQCSVSATLAQATDPGYDGPALHIVVASGAVGNGAELTIFREAAEVSRLRRGGSGPLDWTFPLGCTLQPDTYTYKIIGFCTSADADGNLTSTSSPVTTGGFVVPAESPKLSVEILDVPAGTPNVKISWTFPPSAAGPRQIRLAGMGLGLNSVGFSGTWTVKLLPGSYAVTAGWCVVLNSGYGFTLPFQVTSTPPAPPKFEFEYDERQPPEKLLLHKYMASDVSGPFSGYWSSYQVKNVPPASPPQFRVPGVLKQGQTPVVSMIYARVIDPPDTAAYVPQQLRIRNDNRDQARPKGTLFYYDAQGTRVDQNANGVLQMTTNSGGVTGKAEMYLEASNDVAGENYQVEVSVDPNFSCATSGSGGADVCPKSVVVTTWKRMYLETRNMFRQGAFLAAPASAGARALRIAWLGPGSPPFTGGQTIRLIHGDAPYFEDVIVDPSPVDPNGAPIRPVARLSGNVWELRLQTPLMFRYDGPSVDSRGSMIIYTADAIGVPGAYFQADTSLVKAFFESVFVDVQILQSRPFADFPFFEFPYGDVRNERFRLWQRFTQLRDHNVAHLIGAGPVGAKSTTGGGCDTNLGLTTGRVSYVFVGNIERGTLGRISPCIRALPIRSHSIVGLNQTGTVHELVHQWEVNRTGVNSGGHCQRQASVPPATTGDMCLMNQGFPARLVNWSQVDVSPRAALHWASPADNEYFEIRTHAEPVH